MQIIRHYYECPETLKNSVIALGNFDGVHKGHQAVITTACDMAVSKSLPAAVMTFEPHPTTVLRPATPPFRIEGFKEKAQHIRELGVNALFVQLFNKAFSQFRAEDFVTKILVQHLAVNHVVVGRDFIFGHNREGNAEFLRQLADIHGFHFTQVAPVTMDEESCSSSNIRLALKQGNMPKVTAMLGRFYKLEGRVRKGDARGRTIGIPTANLLLHDILHPAHGAYAAYVRIDNNRYDAIVNIGVRPTFLKTDVLLEAHIFNFNQDIYGKALTVELVAHIRPEQKFTGIDALKQQISEDITKAKYLLQESKTALC